MRNAFHASTVALGKSKSLVALPDPKSIGTVSPVRTLRGPTRRLGSSPPTTVTWPEGDVTTVPSRLEPRMNSLKRTRACMAMVNDKISRKAWTQGMQWVQLEWETY